jgi:uncharacterized hydrophobic protein (TIGR00271 family)
MMRFIRRTDPESRRRILESLLLSGDDRRWRTFAFLMTLSVTIATLGLSLDSAAIVIGAMLIAPLMTPIMGLAACLAMAWPARAARMGLVVLLASAGGVALAWLITWAQPDPALTSEVIARTRPDVRDLVVALAAGSAGAYATAREDVSGALPGVAVAVALVPPLATIGVTLELGRYDLMRGALLLYAANLFAIVLVGTLVLVAAGFVPVTRLRLVSRRLAMGVVVTLVAMVAVAVPLTQSSIAVVRRANNLDAVELAVQRWLADVPALEVDSVALDRNKVKVAVTGPAEPPDAEPLAADVADRLGREVTVAVRWIQESDQLPAADTAGAAATELTVSSLRPVVQEWLRTGAVDGKESRLSSIDLDGSSATITVAGPVAPPSVAPLSEAVLMKFGAWVDISVRWTAEREYRIDTTPDADSVVTNITNRWIGSRPYLLVEAVAVRGTTVIIDLVGEQKPKSTEVLARAIRTALGPDVSVRIRFTARDVILKS